MIEEKFFNYLVKDYEEHIIQLLPQDIKDDSIFTQYLKTEEILGRFGELLTDEQIKALNDRRMEQ